MNKAKLWIIISDAVFSIAALVVTTLMTPDNTIRVLVVGLIAILQPVVVSIIQLLNGIENATASVRVELQKLAAKLK